MLTGKLMRPGTVNCPVLAKKCSRDLYSIMSYIEEIVETDAAPAFASRDEGVSHKWNCPWPAGLRLRV